MNNCYFYKEIYNKGLKISFCYYFDKKFETIIPCKDCGKYLNKYEADKILYDFLKSMNVARRKEGV